MRIAMIAPGLMPIPPKGWGAVESELWYRKLYLERHGHTVDIYNTPAIAIHKVVSLLNQQPYDFIHCHWDLYVLHFNAHLLSPYALTSHFPGLYQFVPGGPQYPEFGYLFEDSLKAPANLVLSERMRDIYLRQGYTKFLRVLPNAVETEAFRFAKEGNGKAICLGRICPRKRQAQLAEALAGRVAIDFAGPWSTREEPNFRENSTAKHLGEWTKDTVHERLTDYSCLVLLSDSEGAPKVVLEAFAAGLSVVISEACTANLTPQEFITVLPDSDRRPEVIAEAVQTAISRNAALRESIRAYAFERFDFSASMHNYLHIIDEFKEQSVP